ncbi:hypothetical protein [Mycoplasma seminis]|uniref:Uncharacterized protein n=1 Tax=Mycoplasma seminis TaxID=512749 RepID=A0ABY9HE32_9MOLU|nr:hypothetical protein [Mycoplasma seminis]WLP85938.1 hypothetical protein Q8852_02225 [Mycoplasma seminis]
MRKIKKIIPLFLIGAISTISVVSTLSASRINNNLIKINKD